MRASGSGCWYLGWRSILIYRWFRSWDNSTPGTCRCRSASTYNANGMSELGCWRVGLYFLCNSWLALFGLNVHRTPNDNPSPILGPRRSLRDAGVRVKKVAYRPYNRFFKDTHFRSRSWEYRSTPRPVWLNLKYWLAVTGLGFVHVSWEVQYNSLCVRTPYSWWLISATQLRRPPGQHALPIAMIQRRTTGLGCWYVVLNTIGTLRWLGVAIFLDYNMDDIRSAIADNIETPGLGCWYMGLEINVDTSFIRYSQCFRSVMISLRRPTASDIKAETGSGFVCAELHVSK